MSISEKSFQFKIESTTATTLVATVIVSANLIDTIYDLATKEQVHNVTPQGFRKGNAPCCYIAENLKQDLQDHLKEFLFNFKIINFLYEELIENKISFSEDPVLTNIKLHKGQEAEYVFHVKPSRTIALQGWKRFPFQTPKRKNYKDLDKQVKIFLKEELCLTENCVLDTVQEGDWVNFEIAILKDDGSPLHPDLVSEFWIKVGNEEIDLPFTQIFLNKKIGQNFCSQAEMLQNFFSATLDTNYKFQIKINDIVNNLELSLEDFKRHFRIKTNKELHNKLIEVFSQRNDQTQRRETVEEALKLLLSKHPFEIPSEIVKKQGNIIVENIKKTPDFNVYKTQKGFEKQIEKLAEKQIKQTVFIDQLAFHENIKLTQTDIRGYLNLTKRIKTKELIHFSPPDGAINYQESPIPSAIIKQSCLREKTLNHALYHLTRK
ncbi:MAG: hypothetical protein UR26_C0003G0042 [candidate division TM6 bacterium GW2011_GWF2_32_72]|nr:MAG: hypothetical protein UR26_C0003G0042 [candidate division TM6 bacterium GW2011_GWF2_32_72]